MAGQCKERTVSFLPVVSREKSLKQNNETKQNKQTNKQKETKTNKNKKPK